jgi:hypothetical protein
MNEKNDLEIQYAVDDYVRGLSFIQNRRFTSKYAFIIIPTIFILSVIFVLLMSPDGLSESALTSAVILIVLLLPIFGFLLFLKYFPNPILKWNIQRQFKSSPLMRETQHIYFNESGIGGQTNLSAGETSWEAFIEATETKEDFYFFTTKKMAQFIPKRVFKSESEQNRLRELAKSKLGDKAKFFE